jgi:hypothetical protein
MRDYDMPQLAGFDDADRLTVSEAARIAGTHPATVQRWILRGVGGVRLASSRIGGRWFTSRSALRAFVQERTEEALPIGTLTRSPSERQRAVAAAERELARQGI